MKFIADFHTHTVASGHAFSTIQENVRAAKERGLKYVAITEHGPTVPGGPHPYYFGNMRVIPTEMYGVKVLRGVELNIQDTLGTVDLPAETIYNMDIVLAGLHPATGYEGSTIVENTEAIINAIYNPLIDIIVHPDNENYPIDIVAVVKAAKENDTFLEINNSSFANNRPGRKNSYEYCKKIVEEAKRQELMLVLGSDAHFSADVGNFELSLKLIEEVKFPPELILNTSEERIEEFLERRNKKLEKIVIPRY
ncbi:hypothetical protein BBF96_01710 [Anoxybacter fermentans]|uniref:Polymerase/histidinol phosphatase N-terminal domain-containing protein n=1 Tax=Anoxybacter fermentans TaxID=1323375 RepID=A0A3Q9HNS4_9FIRM|nr:phosphatase [Anoxybacter fermentans]AZR72223.1 hypothetical protein BBF96_01710 [Anoxybacter fermentans]